MNYKYKNLTPEEKRQYHKTKNKDWRKKNPEKCSANSMKSYYKHREKRIAYFPKNSKHRWEIQKLRIDPKKWKAKSLVAYNVYWGKLKKFPCLKCGVKKVEAHHEDYNKPLAITWLCHKHHMELHRKYNRNL